MEWFSVIKKILAFSFTALLFFVSSGFVLIAVLFVTCGGNIVLGDQMSVLLVSGIVGLALFAGLVWLFFIRTSNNVPAEKNTPVKKP